MNALSARSGTELARNHHALLAPVSLEIGPHREQQTIRSVLQRLLLLLVSALSVVPAIVLAETVVLAEKSAFEMALQGQIAVADGEPANDMISINLAGRYRLDDAWSMGVEFSQANYDFERPWKLLGLQQGSTTATIDADTKAQTISFWVYQTLSNPSAAHLWFWGAGLGIATVDVDTVSGPTDSGGSFNITTDPDSETVLSLAAGWRSQFSAQWSWDITLRLDQHFASWKVRDTVSGAKATVEDYLGMGAAIGLNYRF